MKAGLAEILKSEKKSLTTTVTEKSHVKFEGKLQFYGVWVLKVVLFGNGVKH